MSFRYPSRCGNCDTTGHNRTTCPELKERVRKLESGEIDYDYSASQAIRRKAGRRPNKCSYCTRFLDWRELASGHNRRTCKRLKSDKVTKLAEFRTWRGDFLNALERDGIGPGALIRVPRSAEPQGSMLYFAVDLLWDRCTPEQAKNKIIALTVRSMDKFHRTTSIALPDMFGMDGVTPLTKMSSLDCGASNIKVASPSKLTFIPPVGFVDDPTPVEEFFTV